MSKHLRQLTKLGEYAREHALAQELPYWDLDDDTIVLADGTLAQGLRLTPLDVNSFDSAQIENLSLSLRAMLNALPDGIECAFHTEYHRPTEEVVHTHARTTSSVPAVSAIQKFRQDALLCQIRNDEILTTSIKLIVYARHKALKKKLGFFSPPSLFAQATREHHNRIKADLSQSVEAIANSLSACAIEATKISGAGIANDIYSYLNPKRSQSEPTPTINHSHRSQEFFPEELSISPELSLPTFREQLAFSDVVCDYDILYQDGFFHRFITLKTLPEHTYTSMLAELQKLCFPFTVTCHIKVPEQSRELAQLQNARRTAHSMSQSVGGRPNDMESEARLSSTEELISELLHTNQKLFYFQFTVTLRTKDKEQLDAQTKEVLATLRSLNGAEGLAETVAGFKIWKSCLPYGSLGLVRPKRAKTDNLADFLPIYGSFEGSASARPICLFKTATGALFKHDPFDSSLSNFNSLITGSSGSGKSFVNNLVLLQLLAQNTQVFIIDIGGSYRKLCEFAGGQYFDFCDSDRPVHTLNPLKLAANETSPSPKKIKFLIAFLENLFCDSDRPTLNKMQRSILEQTLLELFAEATTELTLSDLAAKLASCQDSDLRAFAKMLFPWTGNRAYGRLLDTKGGLNIDRGLVVFDLKGMSSQPDLQAAMILIITDYVLSVVEASGFGNKQIVVDECWELLKNPASQHFLEHCVRTLRKTGSGITFITQGLEEILASPIGPAILSNTATKFLLQQRGDLELIGTKLRLNEQEISQLRSLTQIKTEHSEALLLSGDRSTHIQITPTELEYWVATSDPKDNQIISDLRKRFSQLSLHQVILRLIKEQAEGTS